MNFKKCTKLLSHKFLAAHEFERLIFRMFSVCAVHVFNILEDFLIYFFALS